MMQWLCIMLTYEDKSGNIDKYFMRITEIQNRPESKLDLDNKVYIVYDENGKEYSRHEFQHVWDSSPAKRAAEKDVNILRTEQRKRQSEQDAIAAEAKPLSTVEQMYLELDRKYNRYLKYIYPKTPEDDILDAETRELYLDTATEWLNKMNNLASGGTIRKSIIDGTYKPTE